MFMFFVVAREENRQKQAKTFYLEFLELVFYPKVAVS